jgi:hypothetical protein
MRVNKESSRQKLTRIEFEAEEDEAANAEYEHSSPITQPPGNLVFTTET